MLEKLKSYDNLITQINNNINGLKIYPNLLQEEKNIKYHPVFEKMLYNALLLNDLIISLKFLDLSVNMNNHVESIYFSKIVVLNSYEMLKESGRLTGNKILKNIFISIKNEDFDRRFKQIKIELNEVRNNQNYLKAIRNNIIAHKDENPFTQINVSKDIEHFKVFKIGNELFKTHFKIHLLFIDLLEKMK